MIETIRLTDSEKEMLVRIKRKTGIDSWNVLCRWAYLLGLSQKQIVASTSHEKRDAVEIKWETFSGKNSNIYQAVTKLQYARELNKQSEITLFDFIHSRLSIGIRILSKSAADHDLRCFSRNLISE